MESKETLFIFFIRMIRNATLAIGRIVGFQVVPLVLPISMMNWNSWQIFPKPKISFVFKNFNKSSQEKFLFLQRTAQSRKSSRTASSITTETSTVFPRKAPGRKASQKELCIMQQAIYLQNIACITLGSGCALRCSEKNHFVLYYEWTLNPKSHSLQSCEVLFVLRICSLVFRHFLLCAEKRRITCIHTTLCS